MTEEQLRREAIDAVNIAEGDLAEAQCLGGPREIARAVARLDQCKAWLRDITDESDIGRLDPK